MLYKQPKRKMIEVTTVDFLLTASHGNQTVVAKLLNVTRGTLKNIIDNKRDNVVLIRGDGSYKLFEER